MLHAVTASFGAFFALRFLLGMFTFANDIILMLTDTFRRHVRVLCCADSNPNRFHVLP
jgi:hypothetical protein